MKGHKFKVVSPAFKEKCHMFSFPIPIMSNSPSQLANHHTAMVGPLSSPRSVPQNRIQFFFLSRFMFRMHTFPLPFQSMVGGRVA